MKTSILSRRFYVFRCFLCIVIVALFVNQAAFAEKLQDFEQDLVKEADKETSPPVYDDEEDEEENDWFWEKLAILSFLAGGIYSWERVHPDSITIASVKSRKSGEPLIPFLRLDLNYQNVESDVEALDSRLEAGYGPFGVQARITHYNEQEPEDELDIQQFHLLYRMSFGNHVEIDLGAGGATVHGENQNIGFSLTTPLLIHPTEHVGLEFRPAWATIRGNPLSDYDVGIVVNVSHVAVRGGYRWMQSEHESLNGAYVGLSVIF